uniref:Endothelin-converting enzyme 1 n=1 Tax=Cacopsylla melanoneura TaxID=428564 RepID=A0A8D8LU72_9HEMI
MDSITDNIRMLMTKSKYKHAELDEDTTSMGSAHITEGISTSATHIHYYPSTSFWKLRSLLEKCLIILNCILLFLVFLFGCLLGSSEKVTTTVNTSYDVMHADLKTQIFNNLADHSSLCLDEKCVRTAATILASVDTRVDPCEDFYQFTCGSWIKHNPIPDAKASWSMFNILDLQNNFIVKNALEKPITSMKSKAEQKAKTYYMSCMDANETIEGLGAKPLLELLDKVGGWSISGKFNISSWRLQRTVETLMIDYSMMGFFSWYVSEDDRNSSRYTIVVDQSGLTLPTRDNYLNKTANEKLLSTYLDYMTKIGVLIGGDEKSTKEHMRHVIQFETELANITEKDEDRRDEEHIYNRMTVAELETLAPFISWHSFFNQAFRKVQRKITPQENVVVYAPNYLKQLTLLVNEYNSTTDGKIVLNNYLVWQTVKALTGYLSKAFRDAYKGLRKALFGSEGGEEPWKFCVSDTNSVLGFALGAMYVREVFNGNSKPMYQSALLLTSKQYYAQAEDMINNIRQAFKTNLLSLKWMDKETFKLAENKADAITDMIGFPNYIMDTKKLDEKYEDLEVRENEYFQNNIRASWHSLKVLLKKLDQPVNKTKWSMTPPTVNAYYTPTKNQIVFPAGILQAPFYDIKQQQALNYGGMGVVMGHELTHAFDDQGREYDKNGNLHQWWNNDTIARFKEQAECFVHQYNNYSINGISVNGKRTLGENIADNGGLKAAFHAYLQWSKQNAKKEHHLPALNYTHKQLFFIGFGQVWCSTTTEEATKLLLEKDAHSPANFRVVGPLMNLPEFSEVWNCPLGSKMNPVNKCEVW